MLPSPNSTLGEFDLLCAAVSKEPLTSEIFTLEWIDKERTKARFRTREGFYIHAVTGGGDDVEVFTRRWGT